KVRFSKIDSPELKQPFITTSRSAGEYSKECLKDLLLKEDKLLLKIEREDIYGRILGDINNVSLKMIQAGCASLYPHATFGSESEKFQYLKALKKAKASKRGLWKYSGFMQPKLWRKLNKQYVYRL